MLAVLIDAIRSLTRYHPASPHVRLSRALARDLAWVKADDALHPFSFVSICGALGLDADYVRRCILHPSRRQRPGRVRRYAAAVEESWLRQRRPLSGPMPPHASPRRRAAQRDAAPPERACHFAPRWVRCIRGVDQDEAAF